MNFLATFVLVTGLAADVQVAHASDPLQATEQLAVETFSSANQPNAVRASSCPGVPTLPRWSTWLYGGK